MVWGKKMKALPMTRRLGMALGVLALAGCASLPEGSPQGFNIRAGAPVAANGPTQMSTVRPTDTNIGRSLFGTINPGPRVGRQVLSQHLIGKLPFGMKYDDGSLYEAAADKLWAARQTERREGWMDRVTANNAAYRAGQGQALMVSEDPRDVVQQYERLMDFAINGNGGNRQANTSVLLQSYRDTMAARQDTAILLQAEPRIEHWLDYARLELGRRVLGDILVRSGALVERTIEQDFAPTNGFLDATAIGLARYEGPNFGPSQVLLADDGAQQSRRLSPEGSAEIEFVQRRYGDIQYEAERYNSIKREQAQRDLANPVRRIP